MPSRTEVAVSIVVPAYNAQRYIGATLDSVLAQTFGDFEVIVVDDCSSDATTEVVEKVAAADARVRLVRLTKNRGAPAGPRNVAIGQSRGTWIAFLDADDIWHPRKLEYQMAALARTGARFCSSQMFDFTDESQLEFTDVDEPKVERISFFKQLVKFRTPTSSVVVHRSVITRHPFNESMSFKAREDLDCWLHCHEEIGSSIKIRHPLLGYRIIPGQISGRKSVMMKRHLHVLQQYRFATGRSLGPGAFLFTASHFLFALYYRVLKKGL